LSKSQTCLVAEVTLKEKGGSIHAYSDEIPGLHICGIDREKVLVDVITGIKFLYKEAKNIEVEANWVESPATFFDSPRPDFVERERVLMTPTFKIAA
jgi:hypothetical protein